ncbi:hypothetical protein V6N13_079934 [Hibiscus sabdariffa]
MIVGKPGRVVTERGSGSELGIPKPSGKIKQGSIMKRERRRVQASSQPGGDDPELFPKPSKLFGELGVGERMGDGVRKGGIEKGEVFGEREGRASEEGLEETDLVGLGPDPLEFERRGLGFGVEIEERGFTLDGEFGGRGFKGLGLVVGIHGDGRWLGLGMGRLN